MPSPTLVTNVLWILMPFVFTALFCALQSCYRDLTVIRVYLASGCFFAIIANLMVILLLNENVKIDHSILYQLGVTSYSFGLWSSRLYVCLRMRKLTPSTAISSGFDRLSFVTVTLWLMTYICYIMSSIEFYETHPSDQPAFANRTSRACIVVAELIYEFASLYLHAKCLKMFATSTSVGAIKLRIISSSTLIGVAIGMAQCSAQLFGDVLTELLLAGMLVAVLPSSIILGERIAIRIGVSGISLGLLERSQGISMLSQGGNSLTTLNEKAIFHVREGGPNSSTAKAIIAEPTV